MNHTPYERESGLHPTIYTLHPTPYTLNAKRFSRSYCVVARVSGFGLLNSAEPYTVRAGEEAADAVEARILTSIYDIYSGSMTITTLLDHISHCNTAPGINLSNR